MTTQGIGATTTTDTARRKWIDQRIEQLDPERDYVEIVRLSTLYRINEMQLHWFYTVGTAASGTSPSVLAAVYRSGRGTYVAEPDRRRDDSNDHMMLWFEHGPEAPATRKSVQMVNKYHAHFAKEYPDSFADADDYIYILCVNAILVHRCMRSLGLPGFTAKQQRAMYLFWSRLAELFTGTDGRPVTESTAFPPGFEQMVAFVEEYEARPWPVNQSGRQSTPVVTEEFATRWFPRPLHFFGRALVTSFLTPTVLRSHDVSPPPAPLAWLARTVMKTMMQLSTHVLPDPRETITDRGRRLAALEKGRTSGVDTAVHRALGASQSGSCPHLAARGAGKEG